MPASLLHAYCFRSIFSCLLVSGGPGILGCLAWALGYGVCTILSGPALLCHGLHSQQLLLAQAATLLPAASPAVLRERLEAHSPALIEANRAITDMLGNDRGQCWRLVEALVEKYIILTPDELAEWEVG